MEALHVVACAATKDRQGWTRLDANGNRYPARGFIASGTDFRHRPLTRLSDIAVVHKCREACRGR